MADINGIMAQINGLRNSYGIPGQRTTSPFGNPLQPGQVPQMPTMPTPQPLTLGRPAAQPMGQPPPMAFGSMAPRPFNSGVPNPTPPTLGYPMPTPTNRRSQIAQGNIAAQQQQSEIDRIARLREIGMRYPEKNMGAPINTGFALKQLSDAGKLTNPPQGLVRGTPQYDAWVEDLFWQTFPNYAPGGTKRTNGPDYR